MPAASQVQIRSLACSISSSCCRVSSASCSRLRASRASVRPALAPEVRRPGQGAEQAEQQRDAAGQIAVPREHRRDWRRRGRPRRRAPTGARRAVAPSPPRRRRTRSGTPVSSTRLPGRDRKRPSLRRAARWPSARVVVDEREALFLALHVALDDEGRGPRQAAGGVVAQQVGEPAAPPLPACAAARRWRAAGRGAAPACRRARRTRWLPFPCRSSGRRRPAVEIDAEGATVAFEEDVARSVAKRDEAADAHRGAAPPPGSGARASRRSARRSRTGSGRAGLVTRDGVAVGPRAGAGPASAIRAGSAGQGRRSRAPARSTSVCGSGCCQWPATVRRKGVPSNGDELGDEMAGRVGRDALDDAGDVDALAVVEVLERAGRRRRAWAAGRASVPSLVTRPATTSGSGSPASVTPSICRRSPTRTSAAVVEADEDAAGRILDVDRAPDRVDKRDGGGHRDGVVQRRPGPAGARGSPRPSRAGSRRSATTRRAWARTRRVRCVRKQAQTEDQRTGRQSMEGSRHDDWVFNRQWRLVV